jgi:hypothetical protein
LGILQKSIILNILPISSLPSPTHFNDKKSSDYYTQHQLRRFNCPHRAFILRTIPSGQNEYFPDSIALTALVLDRSCVLSAVETGHHVFVGSDELQSSKD